MVEEGPDAFDDDDADAEGSEVEAADDDRPRRSGRSLSRLLRRSGRATREVRRTCVLFADASVVGAVRDTLTAGGVDVLSVAVDVHALLDSLDALGPDLVVVDVPGNPSAMVEAIVATRRAYPDLEVHVVVRGEGAGVAEMAESAGADLVVYLDGDPAERQDPHSRAVASRIERAMAGDGVFSVYQPVINLRTGRVVGVEALTRFRDGAGTSPMARLAEAQEIGLRRELELASIRSAVTTVDLLPPGWFLAVNASPSTLAWSEFQAERDELPLSRMWFEVSLRDDPAAWFERFSDLWATASARPQMALDDTAATSASLKALHQLEPDVVKIAPELVRGVDHKPDQQALVSTMGVFAKEVGAVLLAEGVESQAEADTLESLGVRLAQGYLFGAPDELDKNRVRDLKRL
jgi:EAL domain-containing protein (putative c-di-GMP-specific phosphodiesterase class I)